MRDRVGQLVLFVVSIMYAYKYTEIVRTRRYSYRSSSKFSAELVKSSSANAFDRTVDEKCRYGRMVRRLLRNVGDPHSFVVGFDTLASRDLVRCSQNWWCFVLDFPVTPEKFPKRRIVRFARLPFHVFQILCKPKSEDRQHTPKRFIRVADRNECLGPVQVIPVF